MLEKLSCSNLVACFMAVVLLSSCVDSSKLIKNIAKSGSIQSACYSNPCIYGACYDLAVEGKSIIGFYCVCKPDYTGTQCEQEVNECASNPCQNGAQCLDLLGSFFCKCPTDFTGVLCENKIARTRQLCPTNACGDGECVLTNHPTYQYACKCKDNSYKFEPCSSTNVINKCSLQPCGTYLCIEAPNSPTGYVCQCGTNDFRTSSCQAVSTSCQTNSCFNGGTCVGYSASEPWCNAIQVGQSCCQCVTGFTGFRCETEIDECVSSPCLNGGLCVNLVNSYQCKCPLGYTGANCAQIQGCRTNPCKFGGTCSVSSDGSEVCRCKDGFSGTNCEIDINECLSSPCQNGGTCIDLENSYACYCPDGYFRPTFCPATVTAAPTTKSSVTTTASTVDSQSILCPNQNVCKNSGVCRVIGGTFYCVCPEGFYGVLCELYSYQAASVAVAASVLMSCTPNPCFNRGTCVSDVNGGFFGCFCQTGFSGLYCQDGTVVSSECKTNPCFNNGICLESQTGKFAGCYCTSGYSGYYCQNYNSPTTIAPVFSCSPNPCLNGGACTTKGCICGSGYSGQYCEVLSTGNLCANVRCQNGGVCNVNIRGAVPTAECWCLRNFAGFYCEISTAIGATSCSQVQCLNGGVCSETLYGESIAAYCTCKAGFTGSRCETEYFKCPSNGIFNDAYGCTSGRYLECVYFGQSSTSGILYRRDCPPGLRFNTQYGYCDYAVNVNCA